MGKIKRIVSTIIIYVFVVVTFFGNINIAAFAQERTKKEINPVKGEVVFKINNDKNKDYEKILDKYKAKEISKNLPYIVAKTDDDHVNVLIAELKTDKNIAFVERNAVGEKQTSKDPMIDNEDFFYNTEVAGAWDYVPTNDNKQITVAVVDSGVKADHEDLKGKVLTGWNVVSNNNDTSDRDGHGTEMAGIIAANMGNGVGIAGVAGNTNTKILPIKVDYTSASVAAGIMYAADHGANIINVSISGPGLSQAVSDAVSHASSKNCLVVAAAGNYNGDTSDYWPSNCEGSFVVADTNDMYDSNNKSNSGKEVDVAANGAGMTTAINPDNNGLYYCYANGSSVSAAVVSGIAALTMHKYPGINSEQTKNILCKSAVNPYQDSSTNSKFKYKKNFGYGIVDALKMCTMTYDFVKIASPVSGQTFTTDNINLKVNAYKPDQVTKIEYYINDQCKGTLNKTDGVYSAALQNTLFNDGVYKIGIKAYSKDLIYTDFVYVNVQKDQNKILMLNIKDVNGKNIEYGTSVSLNDDEGNKIESKADKNGNVCFYNLDGSKTYHVSCVYNMTNNDNTISPVFYNESVKGTGNYNLSMKSAKQINISGYDENGKVLKNSDLNINTSDKSYYYDFCNLNAFNQSGAASIYVYNYDIDNVQLLNENGYVYTKKYDGNNISFKVDSSVSKVTFNNSYKLNNATPYINIINNNCGMSIDLSKNNYVYVTKGDFYYRYRFDINNNGKHSFLDYYSGNINIDSNEKTICYDKPQIFIQKRNNTDNNTLALFYNIKDSYGHFIEYNNEKDVCFDTKVYNSNNIELSNNNYKFIKNPEGYYHTAGVKLLNVSDGKYKVRENITIPSLGLSTAANNTDFDYDYYGSQSGKVKFIIKAPVENCNVGNVNISLYNSKNKEKRPIYDYNNFDYDVDTGAVTISIDKNEISGYDKVIVNGIFDEIYKPSLINNKSFIYCRDLGTISNGLVTIDNSINQTKQLTLSVDDSSKSDILKGSYLTVDSDTGEEASSYIVDPLNTNIWIDNGNYTSCLINSNKKYILSNTLNTQNNGWGIKFNTVNLSTFALNVNNISNYTGGTIRFNKPNSNVNVDNGDKVYISPNSNIQATGFKLESFDAASRNIYYYDYSYNYTFGNREDKALNLDDFNMASDTNTINYKVLDTVYNRISIKSGDAQLNNIQEDNIVDSAYNKFENNNGLNLSLYDSNNKFIKLIDNIKGNENNFGMIINDPTLQTGSYNLHIDLPSTAKNVKNNILKLNVDASNLMRIKVVDPFDNTKVIKNASFNLKQSEPWGYSQSAVFKDGYYFVDKDKISTDNPVVSFEDNGYFFCYSYNIDTSKNDIIINKTIDNLKNINIINKTNKKNINLNIPYMPFELKIKDYSVSTNIIDNSGIQLYLDNNKVYNYAINSNYDMSKGKQFLLAGNIDTLQNNDINIDDSNISEITSNKLISVSVKSSDNNSIGEAEGNDIYVLSDNDYYYRSDYYDCYTEGDINGLKEGEIRNIKIGDNLYLSSDFSQSLIKPDDKISTKLILKDEYDNIYKGNNCFGNFDSMIYAVFLQDNNVINKVLMSNDMNSDIYKCNVAGIYGQAQLYFEIDTNNKVLKSQTYDVNIDTKNMKKLQFTDPYGKTVNGGDVKITSNGYNERDYKIDKNGITYISNSDDLSNDNSIIVSGNTSDNKFFIYSVDFDPKNIKSIYSSASSFSNVTFKLNNLPDNYYGLCINQKNKNYDYRLYNGSLNNLKNGILLQSGSYLFNLNVYVNNQNYYLSNNVDINKDTDVVFDLNDTSKVNFISSGLDISKCYFDISHNINDDANSISNGNYISKGIYNCANLSYGNASVWFNIYKNSLMNINNNSTIIDIGRIKADVSSNELYDSGKINLYNGIGLKSENGFAGNINFQNNPNNSQANAQITVTYIKDGKTYIKHPTVNLSGGENTDKNNDISDLPEGLYDVKLSINIPDIGIIESDTKKILISKPENSYLIKLYNGNYARAAIKDNGKDILDFDCICNYMNDGYYVYIPKNILDAGKTYEINYSNSYNDNISIGSKKITINNDGSITYNENEPSNSYIIKGLKSCSINISKGESNCGTFVCGSSYGYDDKSYRDYLNLPAGKYNLNIVGQDANDNNVVLNRTIDVTDDYNSNVLDVSSISTTPVQIKNGFNNDYTIYKFTDTAGNEIGRINSQSIKDNKIYMDAGTYNITACESEQNGTASIYENYTENISAANSTISIGSNIKTSIGLNKTSYNPNDSMGYSVNMTDGSTNVCGDVSKVYSLKSIDIMHGSKIIKSVDKIYDYIAGDDTVRFTLSGPSGDIVSGNYNINVTGTPRKGDINLDGMVNIYDLVMMSKYMGKTSKDGDWDARCDLQKDNQIDILDVTQTAKLYDTRY